MSDELQQLRDDVWARMVRQNERRAKAGKKPMHPELIGKDAARPGKKTSTKLPLPESGDIEDSAMSLAEWSSAGYSVMKGSKAHCFDMLGVPQFLMNQVRKTNPAWAAWKKRQ